jgi:Restriction endonuclease PvuII
MARRTQLGPQKPVQDDTREDAMRTLFALQATESRMGSDAIDERGNRYELKSTTKTTVSTARDVGPHTIERWRQHHWIFAKGTNTAFGYSPEEFIYLSPGDMEPWFSKLESRFSKDNDLLAKVVSMLPRNRLSPTELERLRSLVHRGMTVNNPKISWAFIQEHGSSITGDHAKSLRRLVQTSNSKLGE